MSGVFGTQDYCAFVVSDGNRIVHHSIVCPRWFRVPGCSESDLSVGPTWTQNDYRRRGIARWVLLEIRFRLGRPGRQFLYIAKKENVPSQLAAIRAGFHLAAEGKRVARLGIGVLGKYVETSRTEHYPLP